MTTVEHSSNLYNLAKYQLLKKRSCVPMMSFYFNLRANKKNNIRILPSRSFFDYLWHRKLSFLDCFHHFSTTLNFTYLICCKLVRYEACSIPVDTTERGLRTERNFGPFLFLRVFERFISFLQVKLQIPLAGLRPNQINC